MFMKMNRGFTITEVIITLAITSILAAIAVPAFSDFVADNRIAAQTNEFITDLYYARTEAIKRNRRVTVCKSSNAIAAQPLCDTSGGSDWSVGWIAFVDSTPNGQRTTDEIVLRVHEALDSQLSFAPQTTDATLATYVSYTPRGITQVIGGATQNGIFRLCDNRGISKARSITLSQTGRLSAAKPPHLPATVVACP